MNELTIVGNLTADPTLRRSGNGRGVIRFDLAVNPGASTGTPTPTTTSRRSSTASSPSVRSPRTPPRHFGKD